MIDFRHKTFLTLCKTGNFTRAGEELGLTQPAVSQHIQYLEEEYGGKLVAFEGKRFFLTERGKKLYDFALTLNSDCERIRESVKSERGRNVKLVFGATLSIGEYVMPPVLRRVLNRFPETAVTMEVHNTQELLQKLEQGELDFVLLEGFFDKSRYQSHLFSREPFIAVAHPEFCSRGPVTFEQLFNQRLIIREKGSGTRHVLEQILEERSLTLGQFRSVCEIGNMSAIKQLVSMGEGIAFLYRAAALSELESGVLGEVPLSDFAVTREFNFVFLKNSLFAAEHLAWFERFKNPIEEEHVTCK